MSRTVLLNQFHIVYERENFSKLTDVERGERERDRQTETETERYRERNCQRERRKC